MIKREFISTKTLYGREVRIIWPIFLLTLLILGVLSLLYFSGTVFASSVTKSIPPGTELRPGESLDVTFRIPGQQDEIRQKADIMLVMDRSGSMDQDWGGGLCNLAETCKLESAKLALTEFVNKADLDYDQIGLVTYAVDYTIDQPLTSNFADVLAAIDAVEAAGNTSIGSGVQGAIWGLATTGRDDARDYVVLATDGLQNRSTSVYTGTPFTRPIDLLYFRGIKTYTIGIGNDATFPLGTWDPVTETGCDGCFTNGDTTGVEYMQSIACYTDADPDPLDPSSPPPWARNCDWSSNDPSGDNTRRNPDNYFFAANEGDLTDIYETILGLIAYNVNVVFADELNFNLFEPLLPGEASIVKGPGNEPINKVGNGGVEPWEDCSNGVWINPVDSLGNPVFSFDPEANFFWGETGFFVTVGRVPAEFDYCLTIRATVRSGVSIGDHDIDAPPWVFGGPQACYAFYEDLEGTAVTIDISECKGVPTVEVVPPVKPWIETEGGDVGVQGDIDVDRDPAAVPLPAGRYNSDYLVILDEGEYVVDGIAGDKFNSAKNWLVEDYEGDINLTLDSYDKFWEKYSPAEAIVSDPTQDLTIGRITDNLNNDGDNGGVLLWPGDMTVGANINYNNGCATCDPAVIFVDGDMTINKWIKTGTDTGLVFIVKKNITVASNVKEVGAILISEGQISSGGGDVPLEVYGSAYAFGGFSLTRSLNGACPASCNKDRPSELFDYQAKYLWLFRQILGTSEATFEELGP